MVVRSFVDMGNNRKNVFINNLYELSLRQKLVCHVIEMVQTFQNDNYYGYPVIRTNIWNKQSDTYTKICSLTTPLGFISAEKYHELVCL